MKKNYETVFILTPVLSDAQMKDTVEKFTKILEDSGADIVNVEKWGLKELAYTIDRKRTGFYNLVEFSADTTVVDKLEIEFRRDQRIMRFLTTVLDKHALAYNEKRRSGAFKKSTTKKEDA